jgi:hypothetical protein
MDLHFQVPTFLELNSDSFSFLEEGKNIHLHRSRECGPFVLMLPEMTTGQESKRRFCIFIFYFLFFSEYVETWWVNQFVSGSYRLCPTRINHGNHGSFGFGKIYAS